MFKKKITANRKVVLESIVQRQVRTPNINRSDCDKWRKDFETLKKKQKTKKSREKYVKKREPYDACLMNHSKRKRRCQGARTKVRKYYFAPTSI